MRLRCTLPVAIATLQPEVSEVRTEVRTEVSEVRTEDKKINVDQLSTKMFTCSSRPGFLTIKRNNGILKHTQNLHKAHQLTSFLHIHAIFSVAVNSIIHTVERSLYLKTSSLVFINQGFLCDSMIYLLLQGFEDLLVFDELMQRYNNDFGE